MTTPVENRVFPEWSLEEITRAATMLGAGATMAKVAAELGRSRSSVAAKIKRTAALRDVPGRNRDKSPTASFPIRSVRKHGGILGGKPSKALREARAKKNTPEGGPVRLARPPALLEDGSTVGSQAAAPTYIPRASAFDPIPGIEPIGLMQLGPRTCRWPVDGYHGRKHQYCGASCEIEASYCASHAALAYTPPQARKVARHGSHT